MTTQLQVIERARKTAAEARLNDARVDVDRADESARIAETEFEEAEQSWTEHLSKDRFDIELQLALGQRLLLKEQECNARRQEHCDAETSFERERNAWQQLERGVRMSDRLLRRGRRFLSKRTEETWNQALADQTTWKWFRE